MNHITQPASQPLSGPYNTTKPNSQKLWAHEFATEVWMYITKNGNLIPDGPPTNAKGQFGLTAPSRRSPSPAIASKAAETRRRGQECSRDSYDSWPKRGIRTDSRATWHRSERPGW